MPTGFRISNTLMMQNVQWNALYSLMNCSYVIWLFLLTSVLQYLFKKKNFTDVIQLCYICVTRKVEGKRLQTLNQVPHRFEITHKKVKVLLNSFRSHSPSIPAVRKDHLKYVTMTYGSSHSKWLFYTMQSFGCGWKINQKFLGVKKATRRGFGVHTH